MKWPSFPVASCFVLVVLAVSSCAPDGAPATGAEPAPTGAGHFEESTEPPDSEFEALLARLPLATQPYRGEFEERAAIKELEPLIRSNDLSDAEWLRLLTENGVLQCRERWVAGEPFAVAMAFPHWFRDGSIRVVPRSADLREAAVFPIRGFFCGTGDAVMEQALRYQELGVPAESGKLVFDVYVDGSSRHSQPWDWQDPSDVLWSGKLVVPLTLVDEIDEVVLPTDSEQLRSAVRDSVGGAQMGWGLDVYFDFDVARYPEVLTTAISVEVAALRGEEVVEEARVMVELDDASLLDGSVYPTSRRAFARVGLVRVPGAANTAHGWSLRVRGIPKGVEPLLHARTYWSGEVVVTLAEALERERLRFGPDERRRGRWSPR